MSSLLTPVSPASSKTATIYSVQPIYHSNRTVHQAHMHAPSQAGVIYEAPSHPRTKQRKRKSNLGSFFHALVKNPRLTGAAFPSLPALARHMASLVPQHPDGLVVELGPGTGPVTRALLNRGIDHSKLILIERSSQMVRHLVEHFPSLQIIEGDACETAQLVRDAMGKDHLPVKTIVSSLPLKVLPRQVVDGVVDEAYNLLPHGGLLIQFTYDIRRKIKSPYEQRGFHKAGSCIIWANMPPARVDWYRK